VRCNGNDKSTPCQVAWGRDCVTPGEPARPAPVVGQPSGSGDGSIVVLQGIAWWRGRQCDAARGRRHIAGWWWRAVLAALS
jgi:hypothetical protein